jgi:thiamine-phosphate pyrophosphorylase
MTGRVRKDNWKLGPVYPITDSLESCGISLVDQVRGFLSAGIKAFQIRQKGMDDRPLFDLLAEIRSLCLAGCAEFLVNDRTDLALASKAAGVHLGQADLPVQAAREILGSSAIIGLSTHTEKQFEQGFDLDVDYLAIGPVFPTATKDVPYSPLGIGRIRQMVARSPHPTVAIGGISLENVSEVWNAGIDSVAVISALSQSRDPAKEIGRFLSLYEK